MLRSPSLRMLGSFYERLERGLLVSLVALLVFLGFVQILFRNFISVGIVWVDPIAIREDRHINIDILAGSLSPAVHRRVQGGVQLFSAFVCLLLVHPAIRFLQDDYQAGKMLALGIPLWVSQAIMPVMMLVLGVRFIVKGFPNLFSGNRG
jgi:TRAP-type C4-dicarboxylate transport system permease small subunit